MGVKERLEEFIHRKEVIKEIRRRTSAGHKSVIVEFSDLLEFDKDLAKALLDSPHELLEWADKKLEEHTGIPNMHLRVKGLPETVEIRNIRAEHVGKFIQIDGILTKAGEVKPEAREAVFKCRFCGEENRVLQGGELFREPLSCENPNCRRKGAFELVVESTVFRDWQSISVQEPPEKLRGGRIPQRLDGIVRDDFVDIAVPGNHVVITGVLRVFQERQKRERRTTFRKILFVNHIEVKQKGVEETELTPEDEKRIKELAKDPWLRNKIIQSIAPAIHGHDLVKEAVALQLFGCNPVELPDGTRIRGDIHVLLCGDPGCLVADERIVLGNGAIVKIGSLGTKHLERLNLQVLTGQGHTRDLATRFHIYRDQPIIEIITETGKSIKGTHNHPLLVLERRSSKGFPSPPLRVWKRLDEIKPGDKVVAVPWIPCTITAPLKTGWRILPRKYGPRPRCKLPEYLDDEVAALLGYMLGDGWVRRDRIGFDINSEERDLLPILTSIIEKKFGLSPKIRGRLWAESYFGQRKVRRRQPLLEVTVHSVDLAANLSFLREKRVPDLIMMSGNRVVSSFLAWLFESDGCVFSRGRGRRGIQLKGKEIEMLRDVQMLLLRFGIHSRIVGDNLVIRRAKSIIKFSQSIGFRSNKKRRKLEELVSCCKNLKHCRGQSRSERVVIVRPAGFADVYDIEVPRSHRFIANGIVSHNTAKSQILKWASNVAPRGLYTSGMKSTAAGITAAAVRDEIGGGWALEAGALVIADGGLAAVDEFEKMPEQESSAVLESMEQQTISIAKAGIVATLNTRTAVLAATNPKLGRFDRNRPPSEQLGIEPVLLSRFDLILLMRDEPRPDLDRSIAQHVLQMHSAPKKASKAPFDPEFLRKIVIYARKYLDPKIEDKEVMKSIEDFFVEWRKIVAQGAPLPITVRQLESIIRLAKANARMRLSDRVTVEDANRAISLIKTSLSEAGIDTEANVVDIDLIMTGIPKSQREKRQKIMDIIERLEEQYGGAAPIEKVKELAVAEGISEKTVEWTIEEEKKRGYLFSPTPETVSRAVK
ncbi:MAG: LAGLIDADG family homing endonuclease [Candidatus Hadarchaeales archaeon]